MTTRKTFTRTEFIADPASVTKYAADVGPVDIIDDAGNLVWRVAVPRAEPDDAVKDSFGVRMSQGWHDAVRRHEMRSNARRLEDIVNAELLRVYGPDAPRWAVKLPDEIDGSKP